MDIPTDEDLYESQYQDELDALDDFDQTKALEYELDPSFYVPQRHCKVNETDTTIKISAPDLKSTSNCSIEDTVSYDSEKLPTNRKLFFPCEDLSDEETLRIDCELSPKNHKFSSKSEKRKAVDLSDDEIDLLKEGKKQCLSEISQTVSEGLRNPLSTRATSSLRDKLPLTSADGRRVYFYVKDENEECNKIESFSHRTSSLLSVPLAELKTQYFLWEEELGKKKKSLDSDVLPDLEVDSEPEMSLWVEKYRPVSYMHLLSEEGINRTLLQWLKLWDKIVFGKEKKKVKKKTTEPQKPNKFQKNWGELIEELDEHGRPHHKVAFLCGAPGLGKTTLATIIAKHAGYNVVELNASDDRNPDAFRTSLEAATQMKSVLHSDHRPNCLILDEIDGAPAASINVLLSFIKSVGVPKGTKHKKGDIPLLARPLICICNDQYSPALKPLRQMALVLNFPTTSASRLTTRLHEITVQEGLFAELAVLTRLCEKAGNDIRSCLSTLQFLQRKHREIKMSDLRGLHIGQKDMQKSLFAVWQDIFFFKNQKVATDIHTIAQAFGDYEKLYVGMFENYLNIKFKHKTIDAICAGSEWMCFADIIQQRIAEKQMFFLLPYLPYPAVAFHLKFAANTFPHVAYPSAYYESKSKGSQLSSTLTSIIKDMVSSLKTFLNPSILLLDVFPFLIEIIKPNLRPVNTQLYSEKEKAELKRVIELMLAFNLNYHQERSQDGTYNYVLEPNLEELIRFSDIKPKKILTYSTKQLIAREVEMEQMRKGDSSADKKAEKLVKNVPKKVPTVPQTKVLQRQEIFEKPVLDFFGRQIVPTEESSSKNQTDERDDAVWFRFKEGYSNAVRKTVYIKDLL